MRYLTLDEWRRQIPKSERLLRFFVSCFFAFLFWLGPNYERALRHAFDMDRAD